MPRAEAVPVLASGRVGGQATWPGGLAVPPRARRKGADRFLYAGPVRTFAFVVVAGVVAVGGSAVCAGTLATGIRSTVALAALLGLYVGTQLTISALSRQRRHVPRSSAAAAPATAASGRVPVVGGRVRPLVPDRWAYPAGLPVPVGFG